MTRRRPRVILLAALAWTGVAVFAASDAGAGADDWKPATGPLMTRWARDVNPSAVWNEYPRPQLVRRNWINLNGLWDYAIRLMDDPRPERWDGRILVPFCVESALSGVMKPVGPERRLWYRRTLDAPPKGAGERALLHFGAVDWRATVWLNEREVGAHQGGYDAFSIDVSDALNPGSNELCVSVWDPTDDGFQPRGKQVRKPGGIWYTSVTGIWQTVWMEVVPSRFVRSLRITPDLDSGDVTIEVQSNSAEPIKLTADVFTDNRVVARASGETGRAVIARVENPRSWSPDSPHLYDLRIRLDGGDEVESYFGFRKIEVRKDERGVNRLFLNNRPLFQFGLLDQGWWPDGLYTAPCDEALRYDVEATRRLGFNLTRKHVKIEPARWYYWCDRLGLLVWQDMPSGDRYIGASDADIQRSSESAENFQRELKAMVDGLCNHPSVVMWVPYNEGWGQWDTARVCELLKRWDPTRPVNNASGWTDRGVGDVNDVHRYPGPAVPPQEDRRAAALGEFGGLGLPVEGHTWRNEKNWGYRTLDSAAELTDAYVDLLSQTEFLIARGLAAAVYTQTTDVETEVNGVMTYDRAVVKLDVERARQAAGRLYLPPPRIEPLMAAATDGPRSWRYTTEPPPEGWQKPDFDDRSWKTGESGFGAEGTPGAVVRTSWTTPDIWLRTTFDLPDVPGGLCLLIHHDEDAEVSFNGLAVVKLTGYTVDYAVVPLSDEARRALKRGRNVIAVHCRQTTGGQYIDAGLIRVVRD